MGKNLAVRYTARVDKAGRVVIPVEVRAKAHLQPGATVTITASASGRIMLEPTLSTLREAQDYFGSLGSADEVWSDELLAERRQEARREVED
jgi:AbrB family looped-hinge helix DNA binding protein